MPLEVDGDGHEADNHRRDAVVDELLAADAVDDEHRDDRGERVDDAHEHLGEKRVAEAGVLEDARTIIEHGVDTHELPQNGNGRPDDDGLEDAGAQQGTPLRLHLVGDGRLGLGHLSGDSVGRGVDATKDAGCTLVTTFDDEPARTLGNEEDDEEEEGRGQCLHAQHASPHLSDHQLLEQRRGVMSRVGVVEQQIVDEISGEETHRHGQLIE